MVEQIRAEGVCLLNHDVAERLIVAGTVGQQVAGNVWGRKDDVIAELPPGETVMVRDAMVSGHDVLIDILAGGPGAKDLAVSADAGRIAGGHPHGGGIESRYADLIAGEGQSGSTPKGLLGFRLVLRF